jgi:hypothetical protein
MIVSGGGEQLVAASQHVLPHQLHRQVRITRLDQVAVGGAANEPTVALRIEPTGCFSVGDDGCNWCSLSLVASASSRATTSTARSVLLPALSAAAALIASASSVTPVVVALSLAIRIAFALSAATTTAAL